MLLCSPIVASPTYVRCGTFEPAPMSAFFTSTKVPIFPRSPSRAPGRR